MKRLKDDLLFFLKGRVYLLIVIITGLLAYGFAVTHLAIGMDDTAVSLYYEEGLAPYVGRWGLFLINKVFHIADFVPWVVELASVLILMVSVTLWCVLWKRICEPTVKLPTWKYGLVAGIFISCPLISEVYVFYLHNGICLGYGVTALALLYFMGSMTKESSKLDTVKNLVIASVLLTVALGFYESFIMVFLMGAMICFLLVRCFCDKKTGYQGKIGIWIIKGIPTVLGSVLLRFIIIYVLNVAYRLERLSVYNVLYRSLFGDTFTIEGELAMILKRFWVKYYVNAVAYLPIAVLTSAFFVILGYSVWKGIQKRDFLLPVCGVALMVMPVVMSIIEGLATRYRSAQYVPVISAFGIFVLLLEIQRSKCKTVFSAICCVAIGVLLYNQCADMNKWFYKDYLKYEDTKEVMERVAYDLKHDYDSSKPIVFRGAYTVPFSISEEAYLRFDSKAYRVVCRLTDPIDPHLKEKYFDNNVHAYAVAESPIVSTLQWGVTAFDGTSQQLIAFWEMHGIDSFQCVKDLDVIEEAEQIRLTDKMPGYPKEGYIREEAEYIIVNFSDAE